MSTNFLKPLDREPKIGDSFEIYLNNGEYLYTGVVESVTPHNRAVPLIEAKLRITPPNPDHPVYILNCYYPPRR